MVLRDRLRGSPTARNLYERVILARGRAANRLLVGMTIGQLAPKAEDPCQPEDATLRLKSVKEITTRTTPGRNTTADCRRGVGSGVAREHDLWAGSLG